MGTLHGRPRRSSGERINIEVWSWWWSCSCNHSRWSFIVNLISSDQVPSRWFCSPLVLLLPQSILKIDCIGCSCSHSGKRCIPDDHVFSTCSSRTRPRLTSMNRSALWHNGGSKRQASSESDRRPRFKDAFNESLFYFHLSCLELQHTHDLDSLDQLSFCFLLLPLSRLD
jgi:hypothetical protein